jgi:hypothetical protein
MRIFDRDLTIYAERHCLARRAHPAAVDQDSTWHV